MVQSSQAVDPRWGVCASFVLVLLYWSPASSSGCREKETLQWVQSSQVVDPKVGSVASFVLVLLKWSPASSSGSREREALKTGSI